MQTIEDSYIITSMVRKKLRTLVHLDYRWAFRYYTKKLKLYVHYFWSILLRRKCFTVDIRGLKIRLGFNNYYQHHMAYNIAHGGHEREMFDLWREASKNARIIADLGGYDGIFSIIAALSNPDSHTYIFEPEPTNIKQIKRNLALNNISNVTVVEAAVSDTNDTVLFDRHVGGTGGKIVNDNGYEVTATTLDSFFEGKQYPTLMKIDVEGAEQKCLEGATKLLKEKPRILLEAHWAFLPRYGSDLQSLLKLVELHGYEKLWLDETHVANHYWLN